MTESLIIQAILRDVVEITLEHTAAAICAGITQVAFSKQFPRFSKSSATTLQPVAAEDVVQLAMVREDYPQSRTPFTVNIRLAYRSSGFQCQILKRGHQYPHLFSLPTRIRTHWVFLV